MLINPAEITIKNNITLSMSTPTTDDIEGIIDFLNKIRNENKGNRTLVADYPTNPNDLDKYIIKTEVAPNDIILIGKVGKDVVGLCDFYDSTIDTDPFLVAEIGVSIIEKYQGIGVAFSLMNFIINVAKEKTRIKKVILTVNRSKKVAISLYEKLGFQISNEKEINHFLWMELIL